MTKQILKEVQIRNNKICTLYKDGYGSVEIGKMLGLHSSSIQRILKTNNIEIRNRHECQGTHTVNDQYFEHINSNEKAYWLGFIAGDGCITKNTITIGLALKDISILEHFKKCLNASQNVYKRIGIKNQFNPKGGNYCRIDITSYNLVNQLKKYNIGERKSKNLNIKNIPNEYISSFILGLIDADGCFRVNKKGDVSLSLVGSRASMKYVQKVLIENCALNKTKLIDHHTTSEICYLEYAGNKQMKRIYHFLYDNAPPIFLERKHDRIIQCFKDR